MELISLPGNLLMNVKTFQVIVVWVWIDFAPSYAAINATNTQESSVGVQMPSHVPLWPAKAEFSFANIVL